MGDWPFAPQSGVTGFSQAERAACLHWWGRLQPANPSEARTTTPDPQGTTARTASPEVKRRRNRLRHQVVPRACIGGAGFSLPIRAKLRLLHQTLRAPRREPPLPKSNAGGTACATKSCRVLALVGQASAGQSERSSDYYTRPSGHHGENRLSRSQTSGRGADRDLAGPRCRAHCRHGPALV